MFFINLVCVDLYGWGLLAGFNIHLYVIIYIYVKNVHLELLIFRHTWVDESREGSILAGSLVHT